MLVVDGEWSVVVDACGACAAMRAIAYKTAAGGGIRVEPLASRASRHLQGIPNLNVAEASVFGNF